MGAACPQRGEPELGLRAGWRGRGRVLSDSPRLEAGAGDLFPWPDRMMLDSVPEKGTEMHQGQEVALSGGNWECLWELVLGAQRFGIR